MCSFADRLGLRQRQDSLGSNEASQVPLFCRKKPVYAPDVSQDSRYICAAQSTRSELAIPLMVRDEVVGVLDCQSDRLDHFDHETIELLTLFSTQASMLCRTRACIRWSASGRGSWRRSIPSPSRARQSWNWKTCWSRACSVIQQAFQVSHVSLYLREEERSGHARAPWRR